jgi:hypothetical protein
VAVQYTKCLLDIEKGEGYHYANTIIKCVTEKFGPVPNSTGFKMVISYDIACKLSPHRYVSVLFTFFFLNNKLRRRIIFPTKKII